MPYKDKDKQREAVRLATRRYRAKGITPKVSQGITRQGITDDSITPPVIPIRTEPTLTRKMYQDVVDEIVRPEPQSTNPMKVGYVPPTD